MNSGFHHQVHKGEGNECNICLRVYFYKPYLFVITMIKKEEKTAISYILQDLNNNNDKTNY